jgi:hypothetical protein
LILKKIKVLGALPFRSLPITQRNALGRHDLWTYAGPIWGYSRRDRSEDWQPGVMMSGDWRNDLRCLSDSEKCRRIGPGSPSRYPARAPATTSMLHRCRPSSTDAPSMPLAAPPGRGRSGAGGTSCPGFHGSRSFGPEFTLALGGGVRLGGHQCRVHVGCVATAVRGLPNCVPSGTRRSPDNRS